MRRIQIFDGLRGYFLVFMFINHLTFTGGYLLIYFNHAQLGFVEDAQGFVFLSGLLAGMVYSKRMMRQGFVAGATALWRRSAELYAYAIACIVGVLLLRAVLPGAADAWNNWLGALPRSGVAFHAAAATFLYQATYLDILPQYIVYMLVAPPLVWLAINGRWAPVVACSLALWFAVQLGVHLPAAGAIDHGLKTLDPTLGLRAPFNLLAWQLLFVVAMMIGVSLSRGTFETERFFNPRETRLVAILAPCLIFFLLFRLGFTFDLIPDVVTERFRHFENRAEFGLVFFANFVVAGYVFAWMLIAGPRAEDARVRRIAGLLTALFNLPFLRLLGRHSLQIYAWHVVLVYLIAWIDKYAGPFNELSKTAIALGGVVLLSLPAIWRERNSDTPVGQAKRPAS